MPQILTFEQTLSAAFLVLICAVYSWAWVRLRRMRPSVAGPLRLGFFLSGLLLLAAALVWPVPHWAESLLAARSVQKALVGMVAPPLLWLGLPFHVIAWNFPAEVRKQMRMGPRLCRLICRLTAPPAAWLIFISAFLLWHDPTYVDWAMEHPGVRHAATWLLLFTALLFWQHVVYTGPRIYARMPGWLMAIYLLGVEIPNMAAGITIAFTVNPIYSGYFEQHQAVAGLPFGYARDQMIGGAIVWVFGSMVYISAIIGVLYRLFRREGSNAPRPLVGWDDVEKVIAPGLEHRVRRDKPDIPWQRSGTSRGT